jgi:hypothetical protein
MSTFFNLKKAFFEREHTKKNPKIHKCTSYKPGGSGGGAPRRWKIFKETVHIMYSKFPIFGGSGGKIFGNFFIFTIKSFRWNFAFVLNFS